MYLKKGKLLRKLGDTANAAHVLDRCRAMDLQDRYLNNKATKYMLRADQMANAMDRVAMFLKFDGDPQIMLGELQVCIDAIGAIDVLVHRHAHIHVGRFSSILFYTPRNPPWLPKITPTST